MRSGGDFYKDILDNLYDGVYFVDLDRKITYWNKGAERLSGYLAEEVVGSSCADSILVHVDGCGHLLCDKCCPLAGTIHDGQPRQGELYLHHKEGHRVPVHVRAAPLHDEHGAVTGAVEVFSDNSASLAISRRLAELEIETLLCPLTNIGNRRYIEMQLHARFEEHRRYGWPFGVLFIDVDHFKMINDAHGHATGDMALRMVATTLQNSLRSCDGIGRWGGEEFLAVLANVDALKLAQLSERCRRLVMASRMEVSGSTLAVTVSIGATCIKAGDTIETLLSRADGLLYASKKRGRNRVTLHAAD